MKATEPLTLRHRPREGLPEFSKISLGLSTRLMRIKPNGGFVPVRGVVVGHSLMVRLHVGVVFTTPTAGNPQESPLP